MIVSVEISYYPLAEDFTTPVEIFIQQISNTGLTVEPGKMSTIITGELNEVMRQLTTLTGNLMDKYPSVFTLKISNSCLASENP